MLRKTRLIAMELVCHTMMPFTSNITHEYITYSTYVSCLCSILCMYYQLCGCNCAVPSRGYDATLSSAQMRRQNREKYVRLMYYCDETLPMGGRVSHCHSDSVWLIFCVLACGETYLYEWPHNWRHDDHYGAPQRLTY